MRLVAFVAGVDDLTVAVSTLPDATIAQVLDQIVERLVESNVPHEFTAYSTKRDDKRLSSGTPEYAALTTYDSVAMAQYVTPDTRLDPTKKVADYFGAGELAEGLHVLLDWSSASWREYKIRADLQHAQQLARQREVYDELVTAMPPQPSVPMVCYTLQIVGFATGDHDCGTAYAVVELSDTIAELLHQLIQELDPYGDLNDFTAYSTKQDGTFLDKQSRDFNRLSCRYRDVLARYETADARLDPTKTVGEYFAPKVGAKVTLGSTNAVLAGEQADGVLADVIHVLLEWTPASFSVPSACGAMEEATNDGK